MLAQDKSSVINNDNMLIIIDVNTFYKPKRSYKAWSLWLLNQPRLKAIELIFFLFFNREAFLGSCGFLLCPGVDCAFLKICPRTHTCACTYTHINTHTNKFELGPSIPWTILTPKRSLKVFYFFIWASCSGREKFLNHMYSLISPCRGQTWIRKR